MRGLGRHRGRRRSWDLRQGRLPQGPGTGRPRRLRCVPGRVHLGAHFPRSPGSQDGASADAGRGRAGARAAAGRMDDDARVGGRGRLSPGHSRWTTSPGLTGRGHWACVRFLQVTRDARAERMGPHRSKTRILQVPDRRLPRIFPVVAAALNEPLGEQMCPEKGVSDPRPRRGAVSMKG